MNAFVPGYDHDIFISYAWVDNKPLFDIDNQSYGWVSCFVDALEKNLAAKLGRANLFSLWMDLRNQDRARLTPEIIEKVKKTAAFLMILSPGYHQSYWCNEELKCFLNEIKTRPDGSQRQVFLVRKTSYRVTIPEDLKDLIFYDFSYVDTKGRVRTRGLPKIQPDDRLYYETVEDIAYDIIDELERLRSKGAVNE